jgi:uncharacterized glyoxalase superfamily protein PhnB
MNGGGDRDLRARLDGAVAVVTPGSAPAAAVVRGAGRSGGGAVPRRLGPLRWWPRWRWLGPLRWWPRWRWQRRGCCAVRARDVAGEVFGRRSGRLRWVSDSAPDLHMLNLVIADMAASLAFYQRLGIAAPEAQDTAAAHVALRMPGGLSLELDTAESARLWHAGWRTNPSGVRVVLGFSLPTREAVDARYAELTSAGYAGRQPPFDAFWGARWAIVADPDGNDIGLMSPIDESRRTWPPEQSPDP